MSIGGYLVGATAVGVSAFAVAVSAVRIRRAVLPDWFGAVGALASTVIGISLLLVVAEMLGVFGIFSRVPLLVTYAACAVVTVLALPDRRVRPEQPRGRSRDWPSVGVAVLAVGAVTAQWLTHIRQTLGTGITFVDSMHYHLSWAAFMAQSHHTAAIHHFSAGDATAYYPVNDELVHSIAMSLLGHDTLSVFIPSAALGLTFLAAYAFGSVYGVGAPALVVVVPFAAILGPTYAGSAGNDWSAVWPFLAAVAFLAFALRRSSEQAQLWPLRWSHLGIVGLAAGLAAGTKLNYVVPVLVLAVCAVIAGRAVGWVRSIVAVAAGLVLGGGFWYLRDIAAVGSPAPEARIPLFPRPSMPLLDDVSHSVVHYLGNGSIVRHYFVPGVKDFFGPLWWLLLLVVAVGLCWALVGRVRSELRVAALVGWAGIVAYFFTPTGAAGLEGHPALFEANIRYAWPGLLVGAVLAVAAVAGRRRVVLVVEAAAFAVVVATLGRSDAWASGGLRRAFAFTCAAVLVGAALVLLGRTIRRHGRAAGVLGAVALVAVGAAVQSFYLDHRYTETGQSRSALYAALRGVHGQHIGVVGFPMQYPFYGPTLANKVDYIGQSGPHHSFEDYRSCDEWRQALANDRIDYVVVLPFNGQPPPPAMQWMTGDPGAVLVAQNPFGAIFRRTTNAATPCALPA